MTKVCRLCLTKLQRGSKYFNINAVESFTGFMPYRDQLTTCIPEMALDLIPNPVICNNCRTSLKSAYDFKSRCLLVEQKIHQYVETCEDQNYDLADIPIFDLPPSSRLTQLQRDLEQEDNASQANNSFIEDNELLVQLKREVQLPTTGEIEITNVTLEKGKNQKKKTLSEEQNGAFYCTTCGLKFPDVGKLILHKAVHGDEFICNFCKQSFKTLQNLRKHNNICSKVMNKTEVHPILTKRPHLPTKAKNHLKRWLFKHTDHPYPTDHEKQMLMQETNLSLLQVENWFINARRRILQDFTKLKSHGVKVDEIHEHSVVLHSELDLDDLVRTQSPPPDPPPKRKHNGAAVAQDVAIFIKTEPNIESDPLEIISSVKCEMDYDR